jgi:60S ribosome subunit biogenesis protein NIP7
MKKKMKKRRKYRKKRTWSPLTNREREVIRRYLLGWGVDINQVEGTLIRIKGRVFLVPPDVYAVLKKSGREGVYAAGTDMGGLDNGEFELSISGVDVIAGFSDEKIMITEEGEKLFTYGRDVFLPNIVEGATPGEKIVINERGEVIGLGNFTGEMLKNVVDKGFYLRGKKGRNR